MIPLALPPIPIRVRPLAHPSYWSVHGEPVKAYTREAEDDVRRSGGFPIKLWEYEQILIARELGVPCQVGFSR